MKEIIFTKNSFLNYNLKTTFISFEQKVNILSIGGFRTFSVVNVVLMFSFCFLLFKMDGGDQ